MDVDAEGVGDQPGPDDAAGGVQVEDVALPLALRILPALAVVVGVRMWISVSYTHLTLPTILLV